MLISYLFLLGDLNEAIAQVEKLHKSINTELLGTNDDNLEKLAKSMQVTLEQFGPILYSCPKGRICGNNAKEVLSKATSSLQHRRRVVYRTYNPFPSPPQWTFLDVRYSHKSSQTSLGSSISFILNPKFRFYFALNGKQRKNFLCE